MTLEYTGEERRKSLPAKQAVDHCSADDGTCVFHEGRNELINEISSKVEEDIIPAVNRHSGQWKMLLWGMGIFSSILVGYAYSTHEESKELKVEMTSQVKVITTSVAKLDKLMTGYMARHNEEVRGIQRSMEDCEDKYDTLEERVRHTERLIDRLNP